MHFLKYLCCTNALDFHEPFLFFFFFAFTEGFKIFSERKRDFSILLSQHLCIACLCKSRSKQYLRWLHLLLFLVLDSVANTLLFFHMDICISWAECFATARSSNIAHLEKWNQLFDWWMKLSTYIRGCKTELVQCTALLKCKLWTLALCETLLKER